MKKLALLLVGVSISHSAAAVTGTITFTGAIVESACETSVNQSQAMLHCVRGGVEKSQRVARADATQNLPYAIGKVTSKTYGNIKVVEVTYN